jgi:SAM-dependent methyltransferase
MSLSTKGHWNKVYTSSAVRKLGWYEEEPKVSLQMIANCAVDKQAPILDVGAGATTLIDHLLDQGYGNLAALDISEVALEKLRTRLGAEKASRVEILVDDITKPTTVFSLRDVAIWHDRALLHFLLEARQKQSYLAVLRKIVRVGGYLIIAAFAKGGASRCSGLDVERYDRESLAALLGPEFELQESRGYQYQMPSGGVRLYLYARFWRKR